MSLGDDLVKMLRDAHEKLDQSYRAQPVMLTPTAAEQVRKLSAVVPVSCCVMTDATGENHCAHPPYVSPPISWRQRLRSRIATWRLRAGQRIGSWLAGERLLTQDEADDLREDW